MLATLFVSSALAQLPPDLCDAAAEHDVPEDVAWLASGLSEQPPVLPEGKEVSYLVLAYDPEVDACVVSGAIVDTGEKLISGSFLRDGEDETSPFAVAVSGPVPYAGSSRGMPGPGIAGPASPAAAGADTATVLSYLLDLIASAESARVEAEKALQEGSLDDAITTLIEGLLDDADDLVQFALSVRDRDDDDDDGNVGDNW